jgi:hypothetical protein
MAPKQAKNVAPGSLRECLSDVDDRLHDVQDNLKACYRARKRARFTVSEHVWKVACLIFALASTKEVALSYLEKHSLREDLDLEVETNRLELWYRSLSTHDVGNLFKNPSSKKHAGQMSKAQKHVAEHDLHQWVEEQNIKKGIAPPSGTVLKKMHRIRQEQESASGALSFPAQLQRSKLQWLKRWRRRWCVVQGRIQLREHVTAEEAMAKATPPVCNSTRTHVYL